MGGGDSSLASCGNEWFGEIFETEINRVFWYLRNPVFPKNRVSQELLIGGLTGAKSINGYPKSQLSNLESNWCDKIIVCKIL
jgi:hypothetical protein